MRGTQKKELGFQICLGIALIIGWELGKFLLKL